MNNIRDITIIGAGPVGLFTAFQAGVLGMKCNIIDTLDTVGGQCNHLYPEKYIYDIPAFPKIKAADLINSLKIQCDVFRPKYFLSQNVVSVSKDTVNDTFVIHTSSDIINTKRVILAIGAGSFDYNRIAIENENHYAGKSILYSIKDTNVFHGKNIAILGGGDSAVDWAINLLDKSNNIYIIHRRNKLRCVPESQRLLEQHVNSGRIKAMIPYKINTVDGDLVSGKIHSASFQSLDSNKTITNIDLDYILPFFGLKPNLEHVSKWGVSINSTGSIPVNFYNCETNISGIYAVGDIASYRGKLKLILSGFSESALACNDIFRKLNVNLPFNSEHSTSKAHLFEKRINT